MAAPIPEEDSPDSDQNAVIDFLSRPEAYGVGADRVERIDTHISVVFLAGDRAYKLKKAVSFPYLDFSDLSARQRFCQAELEVNRRTAPGLYERVAAVTRAANGELALDGEGEVRDWLVVMRRFDGDGLFDRLAERGALDDELVEELAREIAEFHEKAEPRPDFGGVASMVETMAENAERLGHHGAAVFDEEKVARLDALCARQLETISPLLESRREAGFVRRCHGDLHLRNICMFEGRPTLFDAIEFSESFACIDILYDLSFLLMDLVHRGMTSQANLLLNRYLSHMEEAQAVLEGLAALPLFLAARAGIRAHTVADAGLAQPDEEEGRRLLDDSRAYLDLALSFLEDVPPRLIAVGGLSGSGKSTLARNLAPGLAPVPGAVILRSDVIRKRLMGGDEFSPLGPEAYTPEITSKVYGTIHERAATALAAGRSVIADAVYANRQEREALAAVAKTCGVPFAGLWLEAPVEVMTQRIEGRMESRIKGTGRDASDATVAVMKSQLDYKPGKMDWQPIDAGGGEEATLAAARASLV
ncbi:MAG: AAA family ATPase [Alphaproteobacteria bacterium]|nr:AAA family ATPase [Alphaproteobacteria bacterium]